MKGFLEYIANVGGSISQFFNALLAPLLNRLTSDDAYRFGNKDETLSGVMGKNIEMGHCRGCYFICRHFLHRVDPSHCEKAIEKDEYEPE